MARYYYIGKDQTPTIKHWRYIKRERKNGRWVYYYDREKLKDDLGFDERQRLNDSKKELSARKDAYDAQNKYVQKNWDNIMNDRELLNTVSQNNKRITANYDNAKAEVEKCIKKYNATPLGKLENAVNKGKKVLKRLFGKH